MFLFIQLFLDFLRKNISVTIIIMAVLLVRMLLRKFPKKYSYILWSFVGIRMIFDISISSRISLFTLLRTLGDRFSGALPGGISDEATAELAKPVQLSSPKVLSAGGEPIANGAAAFGNQNLASIPEPGVNPMAGEINVVSAVLTVLAVIWMIGLLAVLCYGIFSYARCKKAVYQAVRLQENVWECDSISSPFVLGIFSPKIYIPFQVEGNEKEYILAHEQYHIRRRDYLAKLLAFGLLAIYWINPLVWLAFRLMSRDMEMSCDEAVLEKFGEKIKKTYSTSLLNFAKETKRYSFAPIAFGEADAGKRIKNVLRFKKPKVWLTILLILIIAVFGTACLTNSRESADEQKSVDGNVESDPEELGSDNKKGESEPKSESLETNELIDLGLQAVYMEAVERLANENVFPNGQVAEPDRFSGPDNFYKIMDVDGDGRAELIINYPDADYIAAMCFYIFEYSWETGEFHQELAEYPAIKIYDNGIVIAEASHNHGRSNLDDFWPYCVYQYEADSDTYEMIARVDAWQNILFEGDEPDAGFPYEVDTDGDGVVYYLADVDSYKPAGFMDYAAYQEWVTNLTAQANPVQIAYEKIPVEGSASQTGVLSEVQSIRDTAEAFFEAYLNQDVSLIQSYLIDSYEGALDVYEADGKQVSQVSVKGLSSLKEEMQVGSKYNVQVEFFNSAEGDTFQYLDIVLYKEADKVWKVLFYGRDA